MILFCRVNLSWHEWVLFQSEHKWFVLNYSSSYFVLKKKTPHSFIAMGEFKQRTRGVFFFKKKLKNKKEDPITICLHEAELKVEVTPKSKKH